MKSARAAFATLVAMTMVASFMTKSAEAAPAATGAATIRVDYQSFAAEPANYYGYGYGRGYYGRGYGGYGRYYGGYGGGYGRYYGGGGYGYAPRYYGGYGGGYGYAPRYYGGYGGYGGY